MRAKAVFIRLCAGITEILIRTLPQFFLPRWDQDNISRELRGEREWTGVIRAIRG